MLERVFKDVDPKFLNDVIKRARAVDSLDGEIADVDYKILSLFGHILDRLKAARDSHPVFAADRHMALDIVLRQAIKLRQAVNGDDLGGQVDALLDIIAACMRFAFGEHNVLRNPYPGDPELLNYFQARGWGWDESRGKWVIGLSDERACSGGGNGS